MVSPKTSSHPGTCPSLVHLWEASGYPGSRYTPSKYWRTQGNHYSGTSTTQARFGQDPVWRSLSPASGHHFGRLGAARQDLSHILFETELHGCGSTLMMTADALVYMFVLNYEPKAIGATPIIRINVNAPNGSASLSNHCSNYFILIPFTTWIPYHSTLSAEDLPVFSLRLMADNRDLERMSNVFFLGDLINIEASVIQANHVPLRVFMDTCVATLAPSMDSVPRYEFIDHQGCLMDSKLTSSRSKFQSRRRDDKLQVQLDVFQFAQETRSEIYILPGEDHGCFA
ncbi:hypothetical protein COCON_G00100610 [Conger conger]|uniref:Zona pellucida sperm-binding protein 3 n=1 Tax=Conger conger TaxID=82655 RepID=A0A9Q1DHG5_CONCO|nr:hypothetical protein COCON_G00100610 [Conger conger]